MTTFTWLGWLRRAAILVQGSGSSPRSLLNTHVITQLNKAKKAFKKYSRLFFSKTLNARCKVICYLLLIRPIITYAAPIWWNISASLMEKIRKFERYCLRAALHVYRESENKFFISNKNIYDLANIPRIDNHIIKLTRDYYANLNKVNNSYLQSYSNTTENSFITNRFSEYVTPHLFTFFDNHGLIQNINNVPIIYHASRHQSNKIIYYSLPDSPPLLKYSQAIPTRDFCDTYKYKTKYWWIAEDEKTKDEIRKRNRRK
ncbi:hypothetical protein TSAR_016630 [Trichomalopsis sarcophagae]|uniref:Uncharacterized protein n=1 Tax=Trichomalopsis sarcophagae TaxID=543379 RepID=A0A232EM30_9HYME|nr:hypothetical protein TSAR_016630 [Trichomalopsis sarcophagae]